MQNIVTNKQLLQQQQQNKEINLKFIDQQLLTITTRQTKRNDRTGEEEL